MLLNNFYNTLYTGIYNDKKGQAAENKRKTRGFQNWKSENWQIGWKTDDVLTQVYWGHVVPGTYLYIGASVTVYNVFILDFILISCCNYCVLMKKSNVEVVVTSRDQF